MDRQAHPVASAAIGSRAWRLHYSYNAEPLAARPRTELDAALG
ncbi:MAG: hypothetical protein ACREUX_03530 [Burkholderiales bacterium]